MTTYVALLRGINVGGHNKVPMKELRELASELGFANPRTLLASGNLIVQSSLKTTAAVATKLEEGVKHRFGVGCRIIVLSAAEFTQVLKADPLAPDGRQGDRLAVMFLPKPASRQARKEFLAKHQGPELVEFGEQAVYIFYSEGMGRSKLDLSKILPEPGTVRNRNTLNKIQNLL